MLGLEIRGKERTDVQKSRSALREGILNWMTLEFIPLYLPLYIFFFFRLNVNTNEEWE
jgi:hypothetical protein